MVKEKACDLAGKWLKSLVNHLHLTGVQYPQQVAEQKRWTLSTTCTVKHSLSVKTLLCMVMDKRECGWSDRVIQLSQLYLHTSILDIFLDTKVCEKFTAIIINKRFCSNVSKLSPVYQTLSLEVFHSVTIHYASQVYSIFVPWNLCKVHFQNTFHYSISFNTCIIILLRKIYLLRLLIAALHYNNYCRKDCIPLLMERNDRHTVQYPKYKNRGYI